MIEISHLAYSYGSHQVFHDISFSAERGEFVSVLGCNGAGKSTLFKCILGIYRDYSGNVFVNGKNTRDFSVQNLAREIAYVPQISSSSFNYSVEDIVLMGTTSGVSALRSPGKEERKRAAEAMERMGILQMKNRCFHHLSGGERQLVTLARALAQQANILLLDEPVSALDFGNRMLVLNQIRALAGEGYTMIQSTHDPETAYVFSDKIIALKDGTVFAQGKPQEILTKENIGSLYDVDVEAASVFNDRVRIFFPETILN